MGADCAIAEKPAGGLWAVRVVHAWVDVPAAAFELELGDAVMICHSISWLCWGAEISTSTLYFVVSMGIQVVFSLRKLLITSLTQAGYWSTLF